MTYVWWFYFKYNDSLVICENVWSSRPTRGWSGYLVGPKLCPLQRRGHKWSRASRKCQTAFLRVCFALYPPACQIISQSVAPTSGGVWDWLAVSDLPAESHWPCGFYYALIRRQRTTLHVWLVGGWGRVSWLRSTVGMLCNTRLRLRSTIIHFFVDETRCLARTCASRQWA